MHTDATLESERWQTNGSVFDQALVQLCNMGMLIDSYEYLQARSSALNQMQQAWPLKNNHDFTPALHFFTFAIGNTVLTTLRHVLQLRSQVSVFQKELLARRAFDTGRRYISACTKPNESSSTAVTSFERIIRELRDELSALYRSRKDYSEVNRLHASWGHQAYLADYTFEMISTLSDGLREVLKLTFGDIEDTYRQVLDPSGTLRICAAHLALLTGRRKNIIDPLCTLDEDIDILGRNVLHLAAEVSDIDYLSWALRRLRKCETSMLERRDTLGLTPLMVATYVGCLDTFKLLVHEGADLKAQDPTGKSILCLASMAGHEPIVLFILSQGVKIQHGIEFCSPIHDAAAAGRSGAVIRTLLEYKAEPRDERNEHGNLPASKVSAKHGHTHLVQLLMDAEQRLERQFPTERLDSYGQQIQSLKRKVEDAMARSESPESPSSSSVATKIKRQASAARSERHKSAYERQCSDYNATSLSSKSSRPVLFDTTVTPSTHVETQVGMYCADTGAKLSRDSMMDPFHQFINDTDNLPPLFGDTSNHEFVGLRENES